MNINKGIDKFVFLWYITKYGINIQQYDKSATGKTKPIFTSLCSELISYEKRIL